MIMHSGEVFLQQAIEWIYFREELSALQADVFTQLKAIDEEKGVLNSNDPDIGRFIKGRRDIFQSHEKEYLLIPLSSKLYSERIKCHFYEHLLELNRGEFLSIFRHLYREIGDVRKKMLFMHKKKRELPFMFSHYSYLNTQVSIQQAKVEVLSQQRTPFTKSSDEFEQKVEKLKELIEQRNIYQVFDAYRSLFLSDPSICLLEKEMTCLVSMEIEGVLSRMDKFEKQYEIFIRLLDQVDEGYETYLMTSNP